VKSFLAIAVCAVVVVASAATGGAASPVRHAPRIKGSTNSTSSNWSGYAVTAPTPFTDVKGSWTQPAANCSSTATAPKPGNGRGNGNGNGHGGGGGGSARSSYSSFWVGLDGYSSSTVEQTGTDADCNGTTPVYYGWYEFYPAFPVSFPDPVSPGDSMSAEVSVSGGNVTITLTDGTKHWSHQASQPSSGYALSSAEWIAEAPSSGKVLPLANFGTVTFSGASAIGGGRSGSISQFTYDPITMATNTGQTKAAPTGLSANGSSFSVTWAHS
jgi:peptidase A4-like protein